jgi:hypothetical protein
VVELATVGETLSALGLGQLYRKAAERKQECAVLCRVAYDEGTWIPPCVAGVHPRQCSGGAVRVVWDHKGDRVLPYSPTVPEGATYEAVRCPALEMSTVCRPSYGWGSEARGLVGRGQVLQEVVEQRARDLRTEKIRRRRAYLVERTTTPGWPQG